MKKEKMNLKKAENLYMNEMVQLMKNDNETYDDIVNLITYKNIEYELEQLNSLKGIKVYKIMFGSVYANDYTAEVTNIEEFLDNDFNIDNGTFYELLEKLKQEKDNEKLLQELLDMMFTEIDERATLEGYSMEDIIYEESDFFNNVLSENSLWYDTEEMKIYYEFELEEMGYDIYELEELLELEKN